MSQPPPRCSLPGCCSPSRSRPRRSLVACNHQDVASAWAGTPSGAGEAPGRTSAAGVRQVLQAAGQRGKREGLRAGSRNSRVTTLLTVEIQRGSSQKTGGRG
jgi:hypothetical protein